MSTTALGLAARLARREVRQRPWRTLLVAFLVAVPVAAMSIAVVFFRTDSRTALEGWRGANGAADAVLGARTGANVTLADLPPGSRVLSYQIDFRLIRASDGRRELNEITNLPVGDPIAAGIVRIAGRAPAAAGEVLLSTHAAHTFGVGLGDTLDLDRPVDATLTVVGIGEWDQRDTRVVVLAPSAAFPVRPGDELPNRHLVAFPDGLSDDDIAAWATRHSATRSLSPALVARADINWDDGAGAAIRWSWVGGAALLTVMGIVIASAFAAGARRQLTTLGQLAANGASPRALRRVLVLQGSWTGAAGAVLGLALGAATLAALAPHRSRILGRNLASYDVHLADLGPIVLLGILAATIAAVVPARSASRVPVMAALAGRRPQGAVPAWLTVTGLAVCGSGLGLLALAMFGVRGTAEGGAVWGLTAVAGGVALLLGACAVAPGYVSVLGPAAARLGGSWRLAVRSLARQRSRTGAVVSAVCATTALALAWSAIIQSSSAREASARMPADRVLVFSLVGKPAATPIRPAPTRSPPPSATLAQLRAVLPGAVTHQLLWAPTGDGGLVSIADGTFLDALGAGAGVRRTLAESGVAVLGNPESPDQKSVTFTAPGRPPVTVRAPVINPPQDWWYRVPPILVTPERASALGLVAQPGDVVIQQAHDLTPDQRDAVEGVFEEGLDALPRTQQPGQAIQITEIEYARPSTAPDPLVLDAIFAGISFVFVLFVVASSLALAAAETRSERDVLTVIGASPPVIRRTSGAKAVVLTVFGVVLALPVGLVPVAMFSRIMADGLPFILPWRAILLVLVAVPAVAGLATTTTSGLALRLRPVRISTMTFE